jgi:hypothetical protein
VTTTGGVRASASFTAVDVRSVNRVVSGNGSNLPSPILWERHG